MDKAAAKNWRMGTDLFQVKIAVGSASEPRFGQRVIEVKHE